MRTNIRLASALLIFMFSGCKTIAKETTVAGVRTDLLEGQSRIVKSVRANSPAELDRIEREAGEALKRALALEEEAEQQALLSLYRETLLVRAQAAVLLKLRGYEVADPKLFAPLP